VRGKDDEGWVQGRGTLGSGENYQKNFGDLQSLDNPDHLANRENVVSHRKKGPRWAAGPGRQEKQRGKPPAVKTPALQEGKTLARSKVVEGGWGVEKYSGGGREPGLVLIGDKKTVGKLLEDRKFFHKALKNPQNTKGLFRQEERTAGDLPYTESNGERWLTILQRQKWDGQPGEKSSREDMNAGGQKEKTSLSYPPPKSAGRSSHKKT